MTTTVALASGAAVLGAPRAFASAVPAERAEGGPTSGIAGFALDLMESIGGVGAGLLIAAENLFPPIPSEAVLPIAGFAASQGVLTLWGAIFWTTLGSLVGALALFFMGRRLGLARIERLVERIPLMKVEDLYRTQRWFERHGQMTVLLGRMVPVFRSLISIPAGLTTMSVWRFSLLTTLGSLAWNTLFIVAGYVLGANWARVEPYAGIAEKIVLVAVVGALVYFVQHRVRQRRA